jgi:uncharacterized membrane protein YbhN (UPF0104 family)
MKNKIIKIICLIFVFTALFYDIYLKLTNIDMTYRRLFITYWWQYLLTIIVYIVAYGIYDYIDRKEVNNLLKDISPYNNKRGDA